MSCIVTILPSGRTVTVARGTVLHDALEGAGEPLALPCGGQGRCGRCLVRVEAGAVRRRATARLTAEQVAEGWALACQTTVEGDIRIVAPSQAEVLARPAAPAGAEKVAAGVDGCGHAADGWVQALHLTIEPPSLGDNTTDWERLQRELARQHGVRGLTASLAVLRRLAGALRADDWSVTAVLERGDGLYPGAPPRLLDVRPGITGPAYGVAIDIGTTSVVVYLADLASRALVDQAAAYNGQIACGEDVISRIIFARRGGGLERLQGLVIATINTLLGEVFERQGIAPEDVTWATVAGNPTMIHLFLGLDPQYIRLEPYVPTANHPLPVRAGELGLHLNPEATVDCLPGVGAYVGADITAGTLRSAMHEDAALTLFIDVGTNGEIVLGNADWLMACACSAGPAFEGAGSASGMRAAPGAIEEVWIDRRSAEPTVRTIGDLPPKGICGSGMIALLGELFVTGVVDKGGRLNRDLDTRRIRVSEGGPEYVVAWAAEADGRDIVLTEADIQNLIRAKAAIYAGFSVLTESVGLSLDDVERIVIGGAFGKYLDVENAVAIGLLPDMPWERFEYLGNTSIQGAYRALLCRECRAAITEIGSKMTYLELSADNRFMDLFTSALFLPHTDLAAFPSVERELARLASLPESDEGGAL